MTVNGRRDVSRGTFKRVLKTYMLLNQRYCQSLGAVEGSAEEQRKMTQSIMSAILRNTNKEASCSFLPGIIYGMSHKGIRVQANKADCMQPTHGKNATKKTAIQEIIFR